VQNLSWKLGELLIQKGYITWDQLEETLSLQKNVEPLGQILSEKGYISKKEGQILFLGEILVRQRWLDWEYLKTALDEQRKTGRILGEILLEKKWVSEDQLYRSLAIQNGLRFVELDKILIQPEILKMVPVNLVLSLKFMPLAKGERDLLIAISDPLNVQIEEELQKIFPNFDIHPAIASPADIEKAIKKHYPIR
jgi:type IV pilus assembly protein PilB